MRSSSAAVQFLSEVEFGGADEQIRRLPSCKSADPPSLPELAVIDEVTSHHSTQPKDFFGLRSLQKN
jgi:hypothetical protein